jgi:cysteine sulfinate desulfinase/cysteine desulfurase-like protein
MIVKKCIKAKLDVYQPKHGHLYTTVLIKTKNCNLNLIHQLSLEDIFVGSTSACMNESKEIDTNIRISFINSENITEEDIDKIIKAIVENNSK